MKDLPEDRHGANEAQADSYSRVERIVLVPGRRLLAALLNPLTVLLVRLRVTPNLVSAGQLPLGATFILIVGTWPRAALAVFFLALLLDALDGVLARRTGKVSPFGAFFDQFCDHARETMVIGGLAAVGAVAVLPAVMYGFTYAAFNLTLYLCNRYRSELPVSIKSYLLLYPAIVAYLWFGQDWLDWGLGLSLLAMWAAILFGLARLRSAMSHHP